MNIFKPAHTSVVLLPALLFLAGLVEAETEKPIDLGSRRELLVDHFLIESMDNVRLVQNRPRDEGIVFKFDQPWEGLFSGYSTVIKDGDLFRLYYRGQPTVGGDGESSESTCYAESKDGIHWTRPELELYEQHGHKKNNIILAQHAPHTHNFSPMLDTRQGVPVDQRFKALGGLMTSGLHAYTSGDGIHWKEMQTEAVITREDVPFP